MLELALCVSVCLCVSLCVRVVHVSVYLSGCLWASLQVCLFGNDEVSLRDALRRGDDPAALARIVRAAVGDKRAALGGNGDM